VKPSTTMQRCIAESSDSEELVRNSGLPSSALVECQWAR